MFPCIFVGRDTIGWLTEAAMMLKHASFLVPLRFLPQ
jgi:hypothetical protein